MSGPPSPVKFAYSGFIVPNEPVGLISVMPQAWQTSTPYTSWKVAIMARGQAEPPITTFLRYESLALLVSRCRSSINHTVGTAAVNVTQQFSNSSHIHDP